MPVLNKKKKLIPNNKVVTTNSVVNPTGKIGSGDIPGVTGKAKPLQKAIDSNVEETGYKADPAFGGTKKPLQEGPDLGENVTTIQDSNKLNQEMESGVRDETGQIIKPDETDVLKGQLTDVEFNKQKAEQDKLLEEEKTAAKKIGFSELDYKKEKDWLTVLQERGEADLKDAFDDAIIKAEIDHKNTQHNVNMARSGLGMPESKAETEGFNTVVSESKRSLDRLKSLSSTRKTRLEEDFAKQFDTLNTSRKKAFDENMRKLLDEMSISDLEGNLDTKSGLADLRTKLQDVLYSDEELAMANIQRYQFGINQLNKQIDELEEYESNAKTIDESTSKMKGYYTNMNGDPFLDDAGNFMDIPEDSQIVYTSEPDVDGKVKMFSRSSDGTISMDTLNTGIGAAESPKVQKIGTDTFGNDIYGTYNASTKEFDPIKIGGTTTPTTPSTTTTAPTTFTTSQGAARTNRHNNPTAFTTQIAEQSGLVEGVDYVKGDAFPDNPNMFTAKLIGDGVETTKKVIDSIGFYTESGQARWTYLDKIFEGSDANQVWSVLDESEKSEIIKEMYGHETDNKFENFNGFTLGEPSEEKKEYTSVQKAIMDKYLDNPASKENRMALQRAGLADEDVNKYKEIGSENGSVTGVLGVPIAYERQIKQMVPATLMNSEIELEQLNETIKAMDKAGLSVENAVLTYLGFDVDDDKKEGAMEYVNIGRNMGEDLPNNFYATVSNYINKGDDKGADKYVSNIVEDKAKKRYGEDFISSASINQTIRDTTDLDMLISKNPEKIGAFDGRVNDLMRKFKDYPEMQKLSTILTMSQAGIRKHFAGSAVTPSEMKALEDYIGGNTKMTPNNLSTMLNTIKDRTEKMFLGQRKQFGYKPFLKSSKTGEPIGYKKEIDKTGSDLDEIDAGFFDSKETEGLDKTDEDFFNNL